MDNVLYRRNLVPDEKACGDTAANLYVTEETNGYAIRITGCEGQNVMIWRSKFLGSDKIIEQAVKADADQLARWADHVCCEACLAVLETS